jgi:plastocyanin
MSQLAQIFFINHSFFCTSITTLNLPVSTFRLFPSPCGRLFFSFTMFRRLALYLSFALWAQQCLAGSHVIAVGQGGNGFSPAIITASVGDVIEFVFYNNTHSVVQSTVDDPCTPMEGGFFSGEVSADNSPSKGFGLVLSTSDPIYFYCQVSDHCNQEMVGSINPQ